MTPKRTPDTDDDIVAAAVANATWHATGVRVRAFVVGHAMVIDGGQTVP